MSKRTLFEHPICTVEGFPVQTRAGTAEFMRLRLADWVNVVPITPAGQVVLIRQHRWGIDEPTLEVPGGIIDPGEGPQEAGERELLEETGFGGGQWTDLGMLHPNPAIQSNKLFMYVVHGVRQIAAPQPDPSEEIEVELHDWTSVRQMLSDGQISHALVVAALQRCLAMQ